MNNSRPDAAQPATAAAPHADPAVLAPLGPTRGSFASVLDRAIDSALREQRVVGTVVLVAVDGQLVYQRAAGFADRETQMPMREDAIFLLSSLTKALVTTLAMQLVDENVIALDDPVTRWLPDFQPRTQDGEARVLRVGQLLTHTAGLTYPFMEPLDGPYRRAQVSSGLDQPGLSLAENLRRISAAPLSYPPGTSWGYSVAHDVLGAVIEQATGAPLPLAMRERITGPLGLTDTAFTVTDRKRLVTHYFDERPAPAAMADDQQVLYYGIPVAFAPRRIFDPASFPSGGAGMAGTGPEFLRFLEMLRIGAPALGLAARRKDLLQAHVPASAQTLGPGWGFGYGWGVLQDPEAARTPQHAGTLQWTGAYGHTWFIDPAEKLTVVALTNTTFEGMSGQFTVDVRNAVYRALRDTSSPSV